MLSYSQAGQDLFVLDHIKKGFYIEIGASHPVNINNTYLLEQNGWEGISIDIEDISQQEWLKVRKNPLVIADALEFDFAPYLTKRVDYLQVDIDPAKQSLKCLEKMLSYGQRFSVITFEHDYYDDPSVREPSRLLLFKNNYRPFKFDVEYEGQIFEDWWLDREHF